MRPASLSLIGRALSLAIERVVLLSVIYFCGWMRGETRAQTRALIDRHRARREQEREQERGER